MRLSGRFLALLLLVTLVQACSKSSPVVHLSEAPLRLSEWNLFAVAGGTITPHSQTLVFKPQNTLFTDYAHKLRTLWMPAGAQVSLTEGRLEYPVGTVLSKTFYYPVTEAGEFIVSEDIGSERALNADRHRVLETRLLVRRQTGWDAFPYVWNDEQSEAFLRVAGTSVGAVLAGDSGSRRFTYFVPNENQCGGCHTRIHPDGGLEPLGAVAHQLAYPLSAESNGGTVLGAMQEKGWLPADASVPQSIPDWQDTTLDLPTRAAAYLDMNCGHCHNPTGAADTSALLLDGLGRTPRDMGLCKPPVAAGGGAGDRRYGIVPGKPEESILLYRMQSTQPDEMMPELGRALVHREGVELITQWISSLEGVCS